MHVNSCVSSYRLERMLNLSSITWNDILSLLTLAQIAFIILSAFVVKVTELFINNQIISINFTKINDLTCFFELNNVEYMRNLNIDNGNGTS